MKKKRTDLLERLTKQLDALIPFVALAHEDVFDLIRRNHRVWIPPSTDRSLPRAYSTYQTHITHGAFLLGYSYSEAFLSDLVRQIYLTNPRMLSQEKQLTFKEILTTRSRREVLSLMIEREVASVFMQSMKEIANYFEKKLNLPWPQPEKDRAIEASLIRNCIIHNMAVTDSRLAEVSRFRLGQQIALKPGEVHSFGLSIRSLTRKIHSAAHSAFLRKIKK